MEKHISIGIDVSKKSLDVHAVGTDFPPWVPNDAGGIVRLVEWLAGISPNVIVCEPSGGYERRMVAALRDAGLPIVVVNARQIRDFARAKGILAKTDRLDAGVLAAYGATFRPTPKPVHKHPLLAQYVQRRRQLVEALKCETQQREHMTAKDLKRGSDQHSAWLKKNIAAIEDRILQIIAADPHLSEQHAILTSCKGIGDTTAAILLAELPELGTASHAEIAALAGLAPFNNDSGNRRGQRHIRGGKAPVRSVLYMAAISATRFNADIKVFYERLRKNGKVPKVAIVACMRKLLVTLNALVRDRRKWTPLYAEATV
jgi:transposase